MSTIAIIAAAGSGVRMGTSQAKQYLELHGRPLLALTLQPFQACPAVTAVILVVRPQDVEFCRSEIVGRFGLDKVLEVVPGGRHRQESVRMGLEAAGTGYELALIHDGARPVIDEGFITKMVEAGRMYGAAVPGLPACETVKEVDSRNRVVKTHDRNRIWLVQTPQVFRYREILSAHQEAVRRGWRECTDDSQLLEKLGHPVAVVMGSEKNLKVTHPHHLELVRFFLDGGTP